MFEAHLDLIQLMLFLHRIELNYVRLCIIYLFDRQIDSSIIQSSHPFTPPIIHFNPPIQPIHENSVHLDFNKIHIYTHQEHTII